MLLAVRPGLTLAAIGLALVSCTSSSGSSRYGPGDPNLAAPNPGGGPIDPFLTNGQAVLRALDAIAARSGTPLLVTSLNADTTNGLSVDVVEPAKHVDVDRYIVAPDGTLSGPTPVRLMSLTGGPITAADVEQRAFDPKAIGFARLEQTAREAIAKSHFPDARVSQWELDGIAPDDRRYIYLEASRGRPAAEVSPSLEITRMSF